MSILALLAQQTGSQPSAPPAPMPVAVAGVPTAAPWHMATPITVQGYTHPVNGDSTSQSVHPSVVDLGGKWHGYRFWMVHTPYPTAATHPDGLPGEKFEDPCLSASNDCLNWDPIIHPLYLAKNSFMSDPELAWNPDERRLELWVRNGDQHHAHIHAHSADGHSWPATPSVAVPILDIPEQAPCVLRFPDGQWRYFTRVDGDLSIRISSGGAEGPWSTRRICGVAGSVGPRDVGMWHAGIAHLSDDTLIGLHQGSGGAIYPFSSVDRGETWTWQTAPIIASDSTSTWAKGSAYRPCLVIHEDGAHARVWYSMSSPAMGWQLGYTEIPLAVWPIP